MDNVQIRKLAVEIALQIGPPDLLPTQFAAIGGAQFNTMTASPQARFTTAGLLQAAAQIESYLRGSDDSDDMHEKGPVKLPARR